MERCEIAEGPEAAHRPEAGPGEGGPAAWPLLGGRGGGRLEHISSGHAETASSALGLRVLGDGLLLAEMAGGGRPGSHHPLLGRPGRPARVRTILLYLGLATSRYPVPPLLSLPRALPRHSHQRRHNRAELPAGGVSTRRPACQPCRPLNVPPSTR